MTERKIKIKKFKGVQEDTCFNLEFANYDEIRKKNLDYQSVSLNREEAEILNKKLKEALENDK